MVNFITATSSQMVLTQQDLDDISLLTKALDDGEDLSALLLLRKNSQLMEDQESLEEYLIEASRTGCVMVVKELIWLYKGMWEKIIDAEGNTLLHIAAEHGQTAVLKVLMAGGTNLERRNDNDFTPLHKAACFGKTGAIEILLGAGADIESVNGFGYTPLHEAAGANEVEALQLLLEWGANIMAYSRVQNWTPLHHAAHYGHQKIVIALATHALLSGEKKRNHKEEVGSGAKRQK